VNIPHVFAKATTTILVDGAPVTVAGGSHWPDDDPAVLARPDLFTADCRYGLSFSGEPPAYMAIPPGDDDQVMTAKVRARSQADRVMTERAARG
jgi:hypothetical protein